MVDAGDIDVDMRTLARSVVTTLTSRDGGDGAPSWPGPRAPNSKGSFEGSGRPLAQVGPMIERAVGRKQLPKGTNPAELMKYVAAPLYYQLLMTAEPLTESDADRAAAVAIVAARAGLFAPRRRAVGK